jgi:predicted O-methyltransferase YrrM
MRVKSFEEVMQITRTISSHTALSDEEAKGLYECCREIPFGGLLVEIGCQLGRSSSLFAQVAADMGFHTVHVDPYTSQPELLKSWHEMMWTVGGDFTHAYTHFCMRTEQAEKQLKAFGLLYGFDLVFIDGDHEYPGVMTDLTILCPLIVPGGLLTMHDYGRDSLPGVYKAASEYLKDEEWDQIAVHGTLGVWRKK